MWTACTMTTSAVRCSLFECDTLAIQLPLMLTSRIRSSRLADLLYLWAFPQFELEKMAAWSGFAQRADGSVWESLGYTGKPIDVGGGRVMGDTTSLYLIEMFEIYRHTGNRSRVALQWASARRGKRDR